MGKINLISCAGVSTSGKDTLYTILAKILEEKNIILERRALADNLKAEMNEVTQKYFNISSFTKDSEEKKILRPLIVEWAEIRRKQSQGTYFTSLLEPSVQEVIKSGNVCCITDIRFAEYEGKDEIDWLKKLGGILIHVTRYDKNNIEIGPPNHKEKENNPKLIKAAQYHLKWPTNPKIEELIPLVREQLKELIDKI